MSEDVLIFHSHVQIYNCTKITDNVVVGYHTCTEGPGRDGAKSSEDYWDAMKAGEK